jgi:cAMP-dependent protein kinase regulator
LEYAEPKEPKEMNEDSSMWSKVNSKMDKQTQLKLAESVASRRYEAGDIIISQGDDADSFYVLVRGRVEIIRDRDYRSDEPIALLGEGDYFGEIGLVEGIKRTATVRASTDGPVDVLVMDRATFSNFVHSSELTESEIAAVVRRRVMNLRLAKALPMLTSDQIAHVSPQFETITYDPGQVILKQGDPPDRFYIIISGRCEIIDHHPDGRDITVDWREPGDYFGEIGLLQNQPRTATVRAASDSPVEVMALDRDSFNAMTSDSKATEMTIAREMVQRMIDLAHAQ